MPDIPSNVGGLGKFASQVRNALRVLRDRPVLVDDPPRQAPRQHPWKVTANGDDTVTIADGSIITFPQGGSGSVPNSPFTGTESTYTSTTETISASGTLYAVCAYNAAADSHAIATDSTFLINTFGLDPDDGITMEVDPTLSGDEISIPIAVLTLTNGVVTVDRQIIHDNIVLPFHWAEGTSP